MDREYRRIYSKGYHAGSRGMWPDHKPPLPPESPLVRDLMEAARALRDSADTHCAKFGWEDEVSQDMAPKIDCLDEALAAIGKWLKEQEGDIIEDGFGGQWSAYCPECQQKTMHVVRPGKVQCGNCG